MKKCARCGADTLFLVSGTPLCLHCKPMRVDGESHLKVRSAGASAGESIRDRSTLVALYAEATSRYSQNVRALARTAGSLELDAFLHLKAECEKSKAACSELLKALRSCDEQA